MNIDLSSIARSLEVIAESLDRAFDISDELEGIGCAISDLNNSVELISDKLEEMNNDN